MQIIPLVRAKYVYAYGAVLDRLGAPKRHLLERAGLSQRVLDDPEAVIPAHQAWSFIGSAAEKEGIGDLGLVAGDMSIEDYGAFSSQLLQAPNLNQALETFCQLALHEYSRADFYVSRSNRGTWFCRGPIDGDVTEKKHVELLVLTMMIATVRLAAGPDWHPSLVLVQTCDSAACETIVFFPARPSASQTVSLHSRSHSICSPNDCRKGSHQRPLPITNRWNTNFLWPFARLSNA